MKYVRVRTAAREIGVHENTIRNWIDKGMISGVITLPGSGFRRIPASEILRLRRDMERRAAQRVKRRRA